MKYEKITAPDQAIHLLRSKAAGMGVRNPEDYMASLSVQQCLDIADLIQKLEDAVYQ